MDGNTESKNKLLNLSNAGLVALVALVVLLFVALGTTYYFYQKAQSVTVKDPAKELVETIKMVSRHLVLPTDETPTMATVTDPEKLRDQPFFYNAKKGDKVLIYSNAKKAILYDPEADRVVEVAPINSGTATQAQNVNPQPQPTVSQPTKTVKK